MFVYYAAFITFFDLQVSNLSAATSLYVISRLLQVIDEKSIINPVAGVVLYPYMASTVRDDIRESAAQGSHLRSSFSEHLNAIDEMVCSSANFEKKEENSSVIHDNVHLNRLVYCYLC